jgi:hypothetical protein
MRSAAARHSHTTATSRVWLCVLCFLKRLLGLKLSTWGGLSSPHIQTQPIVQARQTECKIAGAIGPRAHACETSCGKEQQQHALLWYTSPQQSPASATRGVMAPSAKQQGQQKQQGPQDSLAVSHMDAVAFSIFSSVEHSIDCRAQSAPGDCRLLRRCARACTYSTHITTVQTRAAEPSGGQRRQSAAAAPRASL